MYVKDEEWGVRYPHFQKSEFKCPCCGSIGVGIASSLLELLEKLREKYGSVIITSGYRCANYNRQVGGIAGSAHTKGQAADFYFGSGILRDQNTRIGVVNEIKGMPNYSYSYCNVNGNYPGMGSCIHVDTKLVDCSIPEEPVKEEPVNDSGKIKELETKNTDLEAKNKALNEENAQLNKIIEESQKEGYKAYIVPKDLDLLKIKDLKAGEVIYIK